jgi:hypothetical protein
LVTIVLTVALLACSFTKKSTIHTFTQPAVFPDNYHGKPMVDEPETWKDYYDAGIWFLDKGNYSLALEYFLNGADIAEDDAKKVCLVAATVSALGANDTAQFINARQQLQDMSAKNPFIQSTVIDWALRILSIIKPPTPLS